MFGLAEEKLQKTGTATDFEEAFRERLQTCFGGGVSKNALRLKNSKGSHMFSLLFACANPSPKAFGPALRIADYILQMETR